MRQRLPLVILFLSIFFTFSNVGCVKNISLKDAMTEEYLKMNPLDYGGRDKKIRAATSSELNILFNSAFEVQNVELMKYYLQLGADVDQAELSKKSYVKFLISLADNGDESLLIKSIEMFPELLFWEIRQNSGREYLAIFEFAKNLPITTFSHAANMCTDINYLDDSGSPLLFNVIALSKDIEDKLEKIELIVKLGGNIAFVSEKGYNIYHYLSWWPLDSDYSHILGMIKDNQVDVNQQNIYGNTPLHDAVQVVALITKSDGYVEYLVDNGADVMIKNNDGYYPVDMLNMYLKNIDNFEPEIAQQHKERLARVFELLDFRDDPNPFLN